MDAETTEDVYQVLDLEDDGDGSLETFLLGWLDRGDRFHANVLGIDADWGAGTVAVWGDHDGEWSADLTIEEFVSMLTTRRAARSLRADGDVSISAERAESLRKYGVRIEDLERWGLTVEE